MKTFRFTLLLLLLSGIFWSCTDHRNSPAAPQRLRLKATDNSILNAGFLADYLGRTEYNYDERGRLNSVFRPGISRTVFVYDAQDRVLKYDVKSESSPAFYRIVLGYPSGGSGASVNSYKSTDTGFIIEDPYYAVRSGAFSFGTDGRVTSWGTGNGSTTRINNYTYAGDNITRVDETFSRTLSSSLLDYDNNLNPFYGLITPNYTGIITDINSADVIRRSTRNNVTKFSDLSRETGNVIGETNFEYDYNAQGLPTKARVRGQAGELIFTYEAY